MEIEQNYNVLFTFTFFVAGVVIYFAAVLHGKQRCKQMASTHQLARIAAFPCGDGELQQVNVQNTNVVYGT